MSLDLSKVFDVSVRVAFAAFIACLFFLFFPASWLPFDIVVYREKFGFWIFLALIISAALLLSYLAKWLISKIQKYVESRKLWSGYKYVLENLSDDERKYLKNLYDKRQSAIMLNLTDPVVKKMETFRVLSMSAGTNVAPRGLMPGFVQPWVFKLLDKHPEYLTIKSEKDKEKCVSP